ncbi:MAG TPA: Asp23/Gls24 family envelope stress response protein [Gaiellaceae bacterium]|nr:Asp23/Gls24 family envelope stress response protein [Gaiellaceae bacterium]
MAPERSSGPLGRVSISTDAIAQIAGFVASECFGVVGTAARGGMVGRFLLGNAPERGIEVLQTDRGLVITLHVVVERGLNLSEVAATVRSRVAYEVGRQTGLAVASVDVHIGDVRAAP